METMLEFPDPMKKKIMIKVMLTLNENHSELSAMFVWKKILPSVYQYGLTFELSDFEKDNLIASIKEFSKEQLQKNQEKERSFLR
ncbi:hypothetical protein [Bacillus solitudinis]|uniref:hypothetical protein n=1 Tax=Bacillus solitudinis TaxID=2014074 RepID=UPI0012FDEA17|nr:hypothetical protein [Bacillus solitudinis]